MKKFLTISLATLIMVGLCVSCNADAIGKLFQQEPAASAYTVTFDMQGYGTQINPLTGVGSGAKISAPAEPTAEDYVFEGWYKEAACTNAWDFASDTVTADTTLYAKWYDSNLLKGLFSVSPTAKVSFTKGNLRATYDAGSSSYEWGFAEHQYDYIGNTSGNTTVAGQTDGAVVDLFLWSTREDNYGISNSVETAIYYKGWDDIFKDSDNNNKYRSLSKDEFEYLLNTRTTTSEGMDGNARFAKVKIAGICGLLIFPDTFAWDQSMGTAPANVNDGATVWTAVPSYDSDSFAAMEDAGCVFMPAAGRRFTTTLYELGEAGYVWTSSIGSYYGNASRLGFYNTYISVGDGPCDTGYSVRLVGVCE